MRLTLVEISEQTKKLTNEDAKRIVELWQNGDEDAVITEFEDADRLGSSYKLVMEP